MAWQSIAGMALSEGKGMNSRAPYRKWWKSAIDPAGLFMTKSEKDSQNEAEVELQKLFNESAAETNYNWNEKAAQDAYERQMAMYERSYQDESYENQVKQLKDANLSVGLIAGGQQAGGMGQASTAPQGSSAGAAEANGLMHTQMKQLEIEQQRVSIEAAKAAAEIANINADTKTKDATRDPFVEKIEQEQLGVWYENLKTEWEFNNTKGNWNDKGEYVGEEGMEINKNKRGQTVAINWNSIFTENVMIKLAKAYSETNLGNANVDYIDTKTANYAAEIAALMMQAEAAGEQADAAKINALANEMRAKFDSGETMNTKQIIGMIQGIVTSLIQGFTR